MHLQVPMYSASGLRVQYLRVWEKSNSKVDKWIRKVRVLALIPVQSSATCSCLAELLIPFVVKGTPPALYHMMHLQVCKAGDYSVRT